MPPSEGGDAGSIPAEGTIKRTTFVESFYSHREQATACLCVGIERVFDVESSRPKTTCGGSRDSCRGDFKHKKNYMPTLPGQLPPLNPKEVEWLLKEKYHGVESPEFHTDVERLKSGEPLAYVIGWIDFLGCKIDVSLHPMIPRPETEYWLEGAIKTIKEKWGDQPISILDVFSGSGCIGVAAAKHLGNAHVDFSEYDPKLTEEIAINVRQNNIDESRIRIMSGDAFEKITNTYDVIFANPPYIPPNAREEMDFSVVGFEPHLAFFSDEAGLTHAHEIIDTGDKYLKPGGMYYIEHDADQLPALETLIKKSPILWNYEFLHDQYGQIRFLVLMLK